MLIFIVIISAAFSIMMLAFFAAAEVAVISVNKSRINLLAEGGGGILNAKIMNDLLKEHEMVISAMLLGVNFSIIFGTTVTTLALKYAVGDSMAVLATTLIMPPLFLVFGELVPKKVARLNADAFALKYVKVIRFFYNNFYFIIKHFTFLLSLIKGLIKATGKRNPTMTKEEIQYLIKISESEGVIKKTEGKMIDSVFSFNEMHLNDVMTPRNDVIAIQFGATLNDAIDLCIREGFSRIPVYEKSIDNIMGFLYVLDLIQHSQGLEGKTIKDFIRPVLFSPETKKIGMMLREMQKTKIHMSIVVDEYGQTAGVCTIEDVVEEIVGEIRDEYDVEEPEMV
ncbi:MAG TPA: hemolysin family protein, partial [Candidatus Wallbacteria bacterium]|nr:hemolysin family protein [Candidatus Wallbacteria bacterium]